MPGGLSVTQRSCRWLERDGCACRSCLARVHDTYIMARARSASTCHNGRRARRWSAGLSQGTRRLPRLGLLDPSAISSCCLCVLAGHVGYVPCSQDYPPHRRLGRCLVLHGNPCHWGRECAEARSNYCVSPFPSVFISTCTPHTVSILFLDVRWGTGSTCPDCAF